MHYLYYALIALALYFGYQGFVNASGPLAFLATYNSNLPSNVG